jgi:hypothetical protein
MDLHCLLHVSFTFFNADDVRTSKETHVWVSEACYRGKFTVNSVFSSNLIPLIVPCL